MKKSNGEMQLNFLQPKPGEVEGGELFSKTT